MLNRLLILLFSYLPATAWADWQLGFGIGSAYYDAPAQGPKLRLVASLGPDWLHDSGFTLRGRLDTTHRLRTTLALLPGWSGQGLREGRGAPWGFGIGPAAGLDLEGEGWLGGRAALIWGLWRARATLELDAQWERRVSPDGHPEDAQATLRAALLLRLAPIPWVE